MAHRKPLSPGDRGYGNRALTGDEVDALRGAGVVVPVKTRNLQVFNKARNHAEDRTVRDADGNPIKRFQRTRTRKPRNRVTVVREAPVKRHSFAIGATYSDSWQRSADTDNHAERPSLARKGAGDSIEWAS